MIYIETIKETMSFLYLFFDGFINVYILNIFEVTLSYPSQCLYATFLNLLSSS